MKYRYVFYLDDVTIDNVVIELNLDQLLDEIARVDTITLMSNNKDQVVFCDKIQAIEFLGEKQQ